MYKIGSFENLDSIGVLCRGNSISCIKNINSLFDSCFLVGQFDQGLIKIEKYLKDKKIVQILNKCAIKVNRLMYERNNIIDLQCNFGSYFGEEMGTAKTELYKKIKKENKWANVHLVPIGLAARRPAGFPKWNTTGLYAVDLACFFNPNKIIIAGLDFYYSDYFCKENLSASVKKNKKRSKEMIDNFYAIVNRDKNISFKIYTKCNKIESLDNLEVYKI